MEYQKVIINRIIELSKVLHKTYTEMLNSDVDYKYTDYIKDIEKEDREMYFLIGLIMDVHNFDGATYDPKHNRIQFTEYHDGLFETNHLVDINNLEKFLNN